MNVMKLDLKGLIQSDIFSEKLELFLEFDNYYASINNIIKNSYETILTIVIYEKRVDGNYFIKEERMNVKLIDYTNSYKIKYNFSKNIDEGSARFTSISLKNKDDFGKDNFSPILSLLDIHFLCLLLVNNTIKKLGDTKLVDYLSLYVNVLSISFDKKNYFDNKVFIKEILYIEENDNKYCHFNYEEDGMNSLQVFIPGKKSFYELENFDTMFALKHYHEHIVEEKKEPFIVMDFLNDIDFYLKKFYSDDFLDKVPLIYLQ